MDKPTVFHQLGKFVVRFQQLEHAVNNLIVLLSQSNDSVIRIVANDLEYSKRLSTTDVLFSYFLDIRHIQDTNIKKNFHSLITRLSKLGQRRNELVHSSYNSWIDVNGANGLLRKNSHLSGSKGERIEDEEELLPDAFDADIVKLEAAAIDLEKFRMQIIDWLYPDENAN
ncbi:hypothetical protein ACO0LL_28950 [Undibacterium sp. TC4M20W]|uniref:hypothetical protein n=1 Tax=Undibacterium sp. TC4M20W TaxID=3413052 RepID=UPI003BEF61E2